MIEQLTNKLKRHWIIVGVVLMLIGLAACVGIFWTYLPIGEVQDIMNMPGDEIHEGKAVMYVTYSYDYFSYFTDEYDNIVMKEYFVPVGDENSDEWMGLQLSGKNMKRMDLNTDIFWNWNDEYADENELWEQLDYFKLRGTVKRMDSESARFYEDYIDEIGMSEEEKEIFLPYMFIPATPLGDPEMDLSEKVIAIIIALGMIISGVGIIIYALREGFMKDYKKYVKKVGDKEEANRRIERCMSNANPLKGLYIDDQLLIYAPKNSISVVDVKDVIWVYQYVLTRKSGLITVGKDYSVKIKKTDGSEINVPSKKNEVEGIITFIIHRIPDIVVGYSDELSRLYSRDRGSFVQEIERRRNERTGSNTSAQGTGSASSAAPEPTANTVSAQEQAEIDRAYAEAMSTNSSSMYNTEADEDDNYDASVYDEPEEDFVDEDKPSDFNFFD